MCSSCCGTRVRGERGEDERKHCATRISTVHSDTGTCIYTSTNFRGYLQFRQGYCNQCYIPTYMYLHRMLYYLWHEISNFTYYVLYVLYYIMYYIILCITGPCCRQRPSAKDAPPPLSVGYWACFFPGRFGPWVAVLQRPPVGALCFLIR